jgi:cyclopropane-fatty-acyl-phospholipid synthase
VDLICRKLRLKPGEKLLDIGCGWGGLLIHAATHYGVTGHGVTLSKNQYDLATQRVAEAGLADKITIELRDYRDLADASFDKIASVGMYEHVGIAKYPDYFRAMHRLLKDGGLFLNHGITRKKHMPFNGEPRFIFTYIFPNAEIDDIGHTQSVMEDTGFELLNMECLRPHYQKTLTEWATRLMANESHALSLVPKPVYRAWKLYLAGLPGAFEDGSISVCQVLASKKAIGPAQVPLTMKDVYC